MTLARDPCTWFLHWAVARDLCTIQLAVLSQLSTSPRFCWKRNSFKVPKIRNVHTWHITWLFLFTLSIFLDQLGVFTTRLTYLQFIWKKRRVIMFLFLCRERIFKAAGTLRTYFPLPIGRSYSSNNLLGRRIGIVKNLISSHSIYQPFVYIWKRDAKLTRQQDRYSN